MVSLLTFSVSELFRQNHEVGVNLILFEPEFKTLIIFILHIIAKSKVVMVASSGVSILFKSHVRRFRIMLLGSCSTVAMMYDLMLFVLTPLKSFSLTLLKLCNIFQLLMFLTLIS